MDREEEYLTIEEAAKKLKVSEITIYRMARRGEIPAFKFGRSWRISSNDLKALFERSKKK